MRLVFLLMTGIVLLVPAPSAWGALSDESSFEDGVITTHRSDSNGAARVSFSMSGRMAPNCESCPGSLDDVRRWNFHSPNALDVVVRVPWRYVRSGRELKFHIYPGSSRQADVDVEIWYLDVNDNPTDPGPFRLRVKGRGIDLNADGDHDIVIHASDWQLSGVGGSRSGDMIDLRGATHLWGPMTGMGRRGVVVSAGDGNDRLFGTSLADVMGGGDGNDVLYGMGGNDQLMGHGGHDYVDGGPGGDIVSGDWGNDRLFGGAGDDSIGGGPGVDRMWGGNGNDGLLGSGGNDYMNAGPGNDGIIDHFGANTAIGGYGNDYINFGTLDGPHKFAANNSWAWCGPGRDGIGGKYPHRNSCEKSYT